MIRRVYIVPSLAGFVLAALVLGTYFLSFIEQNPWLANLAFAGFAYIVISNLLTHQNLRGVAVSNNSQIRNRTRYPKDGLRLGSQTLGEIPGFAKFDASRFQGHRRTRLSTFAPTGMAFAWNYHPVGRKTETDLGDREIYQRGMPLARVDWKHWAHTRARTGLFTHTSPQEKYLKPQELAASSHASNRRVKTDLGDAPFWSFVWSLIVVLVLSFLSLSRVSSEILVLSWAVYAMVACLGIAVKNKLRFLGFLNFFASWIFAAGYLTLAKEEITPLINSVLVMNLFALPFLFYLPSLGGGSFFKKLQAMIWPVIATLVMLVAIRATITRLGVVLPQYAPPEVTMNLGWSTTSLGSQDRLTPTERFLSTGQWRFWVPFSKAQRHEYRTLLPYWRESTLQKTSGGLEWFSAAKVQDLGTVVEVVTPNTLRGKLFQLSRLPANKAQLSATDRPVAIQFRGAPSPQLQSLIDELGLARIPATVAARRVIEWMRNQAFRYSLTPGPTKSMDSFLFETKIGLCQHYAGALAYILLQSGFKARVVAGYQGGDVNPLADTLIVRDYDAHGWVEVWDSAQSGWLSVDPTYELFPGEYRAEQPTKLAKIFAWVVVAIESLARKLSALAKGVTIAAFIALFATVGITVRRFSQRHRRDSVINNQSLAAPTIPMSGALKAWEDRVEALSGSARAPAEGLHTYWDRVKPAVAQRIPIADLTTIEAGLHRIVSELYRSR